jgi:hypothetical protein
MKWQTIAIELEEPMHYFCCLSRQYIDSQISIIIRGTNCDSLFRLLQNLLACCADTFGPADVGLKEENRDDRGHGMLGLNRLSSVARWAQPMTYVDVYECDSFTVSFTSSLSIRICSCWDSCVLRCFSFRLYIYISIPWQNLKSVVKLI